MSEFDGYSSEHINFDRIRYDPERDGVWIGDVAFLPRAVVIRAVSALTSEDGGPPLSRQPDT